MKKIAIIGCLGMVGIITTEFGIIGILPQIAAHYQITIDKAGILLSAFALVIALTGPFMTLLASGTDRRKIMIAAIVLFVATGLVSSLAPPFWLLLVVRLIPAFLQPVYISTAIAAAVHQAGREKEHQLMGIVLGGIAIAMVTTVPFATYMASIFTWQASFIVQTVISLTALAAILKIMPAMPISERKTFGSQLKILTNLKFILSTAMNFFMIAAWFSTYSYFADYLGKTKHMSPQMISYMMLLFGLTGITANWVAGKMLSKSIAMTTAIFVSGTILIPIALHFSGSDSTTIILIIALWGFFYAPCFLNASAYMISAAPHALEFANTLSTSFGNLGVTAGTVAGGIIISSYGLACIPWAGAAFGLLSLAMIAWRTLLDAKTAPVQGK